MTAWSLAVAALLVGGLLPGLLLSSRGTATDRLVGVQITSAVAVIVLLLMSQDAGQSSYLIVPQVLTVLSFAGTLVFTRLLGPDRT